MDGSDGRGRRCKVQHDDGKGVEHSGRRESGRVNRSRRNRRTEDTTHTSYIQSSTDNGLRRTLRRSSKSSTCNGQFSSNSNCTTPDTSTESGHRKIPGYYYDPVKNRYFKTSQDHTEKSFIHDQSETVSRNSECLKSNRIPQTRLHHFRKRELTYAYNPAISLRRDLEDWARRLVEKNHFTHDHSIHHPCPDYDGFISNVALSSNCRKMVAVVKLSGMEGCNMFHELYNVTYDNEKFVKPKMFATVVSGQVSHVEWNPDKNMENFLLLSDLGSGDSPGSGVICKFSESSPSSLCLLDHYPLARGTAWHCSWCQNPQYSNLVGVGGSEQAMLIDVEKKTKLCRIGSPSDIFSVEFAHKSPVIFFGRRSGDILRVDIRATRKRTYIGPKHHSSMTCIKMMEDENYLMASNYDGMIKMWDVRLSKAVKEYRGNVNEAKLIPFVMDSSQSIIASAGEDGKTRIWSVGSCKLLNTIDRPGPNCEDGNVPAVCLGENWGNKKGLMALGVTSSDKLYFYY